MATNRDERGRFLKGMNGGPGRPTKEREMKYYAIFHNIVTEDEFRIVVAKMLEQAQRGNSYARKQLLSYLLGEPNQYIDLNQSGAMKLVIEHVRVASPDTGAASNSGQSQVGS